MVYRVTTSTVQAFVREVQNVAEGLLRIGANADRDGMQTPEAMTEHLQRLALERLRLDFCVRDAVTVARESHGFSWAQIGTALGVSRQAAQQRFG